MAIFFFNFWYKGFNGLPPLASQVVETFFFFQKKDCEFINLRRLNQPKKLDDCLVIYLSSRWLNQTKLLSLQLDNELYYYLDEDRKNLCKNKKRRVFSHPELNVYVKAKEGSLFIRAITSVCAKLCKMEKLTDFIHFEQKNTHISGCKIVHKCVIATVTMHICTVTVACAFNILIIFYSLLFFSLFSICKTNPPSHVLSSSNTHTPTDTKSKINHQNKIIGSVIVDCGLERRFGSVMWIGVDGDQC